jgi:methyl-accepting chemotaxis protein
VFYPYSRRLKLNSLKLSVSTKTSIICGVIVFVILSINTTIFNRLESSLLNTVFDEYVKRVETTIDTQGENIKQSLKNRVTVISKICAKVAASSLYNVDSKTLVMALKSYMDFDGLTAIQVFDESGKPVAAVWRTTEILDGEKIPDDYVYNKQLVVSSDSIYETQKIGSLNCFYSDDAITKKMEQDKKNASDSISSFRSIVDSKFSKATMLQIFILFCIIVILVIAINRSLFMIMSKPLYKLKLMVMDLVEGEGDLTKRLKVITQDEIGDLAGWFNKFIERIQSLVKELSYSVGTLNASSSTMTDISVLLAKNADIVSIKSSTVAAATEEMSTNMAHVADASEQTTSNVSMVAAATEEMNVTFNEISINSEKARGVTQTAVNRAKDASRRVNELGNAAYEINKVTETINEISDQTNLLALNATIEAARAGEAGKGFAVVANEIKELAKQTADATRDIKVKIDDIQSSTKGTVSEITEISQVIHAVNESVTAIARAVKEQDIATREISQNVAQASQGIQKVHERMAQNSEVASKISKDIADVNTSSNDMAASSSKVKKGAEELSGLADQISRQVRQFKV